MDIKIQPGAQVAQISEGNELTGSQDVVSSEKSPVSDDPVTRIAMDLVEGRISSEEAVDRLIEQTMDSSMIENAPTDIREELAQVLKVAIQTDPYLQSLAKDLS